ncbi:hypothetical protein [Streptomyces mirabilis]|uniref:hypothetical protein n=1 Tax=Streptomyces mirabilis TaxID=68239 RepID=UPI0036EAD3EF
MAALYKAERPNALPSAVHDFLSGKSTKNVVENLSGNGPNQLLYTNGLCLAGRHGSQAESV